MKRYTLIDNKHNSITNYSAGAWNLAWAIVWISGVLVGAILAVCA